MAPILGFSRFAKMDVSPFELLLGVSSLELLLGASSLELLLGASSLELLLGVSSLELLLGVSSLELLLGASSLELLLGASSLELLWVSLLLDWFVLEDEIASQTAVSVVLLVTMSFRKSQNEPSISLTQPRKVKPSFVGSAGSLILPPLAIVCLSTAEPSSLSKVMV
jgi:hypothetical protein